MNEIKQVMDNDSRGAFVIEAGEERIAEMAFGINKELLIVYHTEVDDRLKGQGIAQQLLDHMVNFARSHHYKVVPLCPYVNVQFRRHADKYGDLVASMPGH